MNGRIFTIFKPTEINIIKTVHQLTEKTATGNGNFQPEIEINEYSSSKKLLE